VGMSRHVYAATKKCVLSLLRKVDKELVASIANVDQQRVPDIRSGHTECSLSCLGAHPGDEQPQSISGPQ